MNEILIGLIGTIIVSIASIITTIITNNATRKLIAYRLDQVETRVDDLSKKVEAHNNFALQITEIKTRVSILEGKV